MKKWKQQFDFQMNLKKGNKVEKKRDICPQRMYENILEVKRMSVRIHYAPLAVQDMDEIWEYEIHLDVITYK